MNFQIHVNEDRELIKELGVHGQVVSVPIGKTLIDLVCNDYKRRYDTPKSETNPLIKRMVSEIKKGNVKDIDKLLQDYLFLVGYVLDLDHYKDGNDVNRKNISKRYIDAQKVIGSDFRPENPSKAMFHSYTYSTSNENMEDSTQSREGQRNQDIFIIWFVDNIKEAFYILFNHMMTNQVMVRKCSCCGLFFIPNGRIDSKYCNRIAPNSTKTCREVGASIKYYDKMTENELFTIFQKSYKKMNARTRSKSLSKEDFLIWSTQARALRDAAIKTNMDIAEFNKKLNEIETYIKHQ